MQFLVVAHVVLRMNSSLKYHDLPSYTSERYYLLSELEQRMKFIFLDEMANTTLPDNLGNLYYYLLWDMRQYGVDAIITRLGALLNSPLKSQRRMLSLEVMISEGAQTLNCSHNESVLSVYRWIQANAPEFTIVVFGIADKVSGTPALEAIFECTKKNAVIRSDFLVVSTRDALLGHDQNRDPDADNDLYQALLYSANDSDSSWVIGDGQSDIPKTTNIDPLILQMHQSSFLICIFLVFLVLNYFHLFTVSPVM